MWAAPKDSAGRSLVPFDLEPPCVRLVEEIEEAIGILVTLQHLFRSKRCRFRKEEGKRTLFIDRIVMNGRVADLIDKSLKQPPTLARGALGRNRCHCSIP